MPSQSLRKRYQSIFRVVIRTINSPSASGVNIGLDAELRDQVDRDISPDGYGRHGSSKDSGGREGGSSELHRENCEFIEKGEYVNDRI